MKGDLHPDRLGETEGNGQRYSSRSGASPSRSRSTNSPWIRSSPDSGSSCRIGKRSKYHSAGTPDPGSPSLPLIGPRGSRPSSPASRFPSSARSASRSGRAPRLPQAQETAAPAPVNASHSEAVERGLASVSSIGVPVQLEGLGDAVHRPRKLHPPRLRRAPETPGDLRPLPALRAKVGDLPLLVVKPEPDGVDQVMVRRKLTRPRVSARDVQVIHPRGCEQPVVAPPRPVTPHLEGQLVAGHLQEQLDELLGRLQRRNGRSMRARRNWSRPTARCPSSRRSAAADDLRFADVPLAGSRLRNDGPTPGPRPRSRPGFAG